MQKPKKHLFFLRMEEQRGDGASINVSGNLVANGTFVVGNATWNGVAAAAVAAAAATAAGRSSSFCLVVSCFDDAAGLGPELVFRGDRKNFCPFGEFFFFSTTVQR
jgi:hypothetical protein